MKAITLNDYKTQKISEATIIQKILAGEKELFEILVRRNNQKFYRSIRGYLKDDAEIEDVMQNSYIKSFTKLYQFRLEASFSTWLIRIGINEALARLKEKGKLHHLNSTEDSQFSNTILEMPDHKQLNPQSRMIRNEAKQLLEDAIDQLDVKYRSVYILSEIEQMSHKEISVALDLTVANVKVRLHRAKALLKEKLYELSKDGELFEFGFSRCDRVTEHVMKVINEENQ